MTLAIDRKRLNQIVKAGEMFLHTPSESATAYVQSVEELLAAPQIDYGSRLLDKNITPMRPGEVTVVKARPGNGKTSFLIYMARRHAQRLVETRQDVNKCVIYVTWEEPIESIEMSIQSGIDYTAEDVAWGRVDPDLVTRKAVKRPGLPLYVFGRSLIRDRSKRKPPMTIDLVIDTIYALFYEFGIEPVLICGDYLQKVPVPKKRDRISEVTEAMFSLSTLSMDVNCPILLAVQASRDVDDQALPIPTLSGGQWTSAIEQEAFREVGILRPSTVITKAGKSLERIDIGGVEYEVTKDLMLIRLLKQRKFFPERNTFPVHFKPDKFELYDIDPITGVAY
jgi:hypothetical protein